MKYVIRDIYFLCILFCGFTGYAQQQWKSVKIVTNVNDTLQGQLNFEDWDRSPAAIQFKDGQGNVTTKTAQEIRSFTIQEPLKTYESKKLTLAYYENGVVAEGKSPIVKTDSVTLFIEVLLHSARVTLYECLDEDKEPRYFLRKDDKLHELRNPVYRVAKGETSHIVRNEVYKTQLTLLLSECPTLNTENLGYTDKELVDLLIKYHKYCKADYSGESHQEGLGQRFAIGAMFRHAPEIAAPTSFLGLNALIFSKKRFNSLFVAIDVGYGLGPFEDDPTSSAKTNRLCFGLYGGKYFGLNEWHPMIFTGISNTNGALDTGVGISYQRLVSLSTSAGLIYLIKGDAAWSIQLRITPFTQKN